MEGGHCGKREKENTEMGRKCNGEEVEESERGEKKTRREWRGGKGRRAGMDRERGELRK